MTTSMWGRMSSQLWNSSRSWRALRNTWRILNRHNLVFIFSTQSECISLWNWWDLISICCRFSFVPPSSRIYDGKLFCHWHSKAAYCVMLPTIKKHSPFSYLFHFFTIIITTTFLNWPTNPPSRPYRLSMAISSSSKWEGSWNALNIA